MVKTVSIAVLSVLFLNLAACSGFPSRILPNESEIERTTIEYVDDNMQANPQGQLLSTIVSIEKPDALRLFDTLKNSLYSANKQKTDSKITYILSYYDKEGNKIFSMGIKENQSVAIYFRDGSGYSEGGVFEDFIKEMKVVNEKYGINDIL